MSQDPPPISKKLEKKAQRDAERRKSGKKRKRRRERKRNQKSWIAVAGGTVAFIMAPYGKGPPGMRVATVDSNMRSAIPHRRAISRPPAASSLVSRRPRLLLPFRLSCREPTPSMWTLRMRITRPHRRSPIPHRRQPLTIARRRHCGQRLA